MTDKELTKKQQTAVTRREPHEETAVFVPSADIFETPEAMILRLDMPGVGPDDVEVHVQRGILKIQGKTKAAGFDKALYAEQRTGDYEREFVLSEDLDPDAITAQMNAGVLTVTVGKAAKVKPRKIAITAG